MFPTLVSILESAELNNVVKLKPSRGLIANDGAIPISGRQDVIGPITRTVKEAAYMLSMAGCSGKDERPWNIPFDRIPGFATHCESADLTGITIGVPQNTFSADLTSPIMVFFESMIETFRRAGVKEVDTADFPDTDEFKN